MLKSPIIYYCSGKPRSLSRCHTKKWTSRSRPSPGRPTHLPFQIRWRLTFLCHNRLAPPTVESHLPRYIVCCKRLAFDFTTCTGSNRGSFESCEEFEGTFTPHNWVFLEHSPTWFSLKIEPNNRPALRVRSCSLLQRNLNAQIQSVGQVTKYYGTHRHTQIWKCLRDKALGPICFVCSAKVAWNKSWKTVSKPISYYIDVHNSQKFRN